MIGSTPTAAFVDDDDARFIDQVSDGCREHGVAARDFPLLLEHDKEKSVRAPLLVRLSFGSHLTRQRAVFSKKLAPSFSQMAHKMLYFNQLRTLTHVDSA